MIFAKWNVAKGSDYHCIGYWSIFCNETDYSDCIPIEKRTGPMGTLIDCCEYNHDNHYIHYFAGASFIEWYPNNRWVDAIPVPPQDIYNCIREYDWMCGACATCVRKEKEKQNELD